MPSPLPISQLPIVGAPMAGGPTTVALARAVARAGGLPFLAGGYKSGDELAREIDSLRTDGAPFGVNLFVPSDTEIDAKSFAQYVASLHAEADQYGLRLDPQPLNDDDGWTDKIGLLLDAPVPVVSLTFGLPSQADITALQQAGSAVLATVTTPAEAKIAEAAKVDGLIVQAPAAGGHSATFDPGRHIEPISLTSLLAQMRAESTLPLIGAGGIDSPEQVRSALDAGATSVAIGTMLLRTEEAGTSATHRAALANPEFTETVITRAFTGRPARALHNQFIDRHDDAAPLAYPAVHHATRALRQAAARAGDAQNLHLWAGTGFRNAPEGSAAEVIAYLASDL